MFKAVAILLFTHVCRYMTHPDTCIDTHMSSYIIMSVLKDCIEYVYWDHHVCRSYMMQPLGGE